MFPERENEAARGRERRLWGKFCTHMHIESSQNNLAPTLIYAATHISVGVIIYYFWPNPVED